MSGRRPAERPALTAATADWLDWPADESLGPLLALAADAERRQAWPDLVHVLTWLGQVQAAMGEPAADDTLAQSREVAARCDDFELVGIVAMVQARHDADLGQHASALAICRNMVDQARQRGHVAIVRQALFTSGISLCHLGEHDLALEALEEARVLLRTRPGPLPEFERRVVLGRYASAQAQAWLMRGGLLLEASGPEAAADALQRARQLGEQACGLLMGASARFSHAALFGLVRALLEAGEGDEARRWVQRVTTACPLPAPRASLSLVQLVLSEAMIELRSGPCDALQVLGHLAEAQASRHPRVVSGDLRLSLLRCQFEANEACGQFSEALALQREWSATKSLLRARLAKEHGQWTAETRAGLRAEADDFVSQALRAPLVEACQGLSTVRPDAPAVEAGIHRAEHSVRRAIDIAEQYLGVVRAEFLRQEDLQTIDLSELVDDICDQMAPASGGLVGLERRIARPMTVRGDKLLLMRALANLISNALKHAPDGSTVEVVLERQGTAARLSVKDQGPGMPLEIRARIFQRFATGAVRKGNGLGLAMVARAARVHGARIVVDSEPGRGTCVAILLACLQGEDQAGGNAAGRDAPRRAHSDEHLA